MIELRGVTKQYLYGASVLGGCDLKVEKGEIVALLGDEGSGKTTLLKVIADVTDCEGEVLIDGAPIGKRPDDVLMVFDDLAIFAGRSCRYNLSYPLLIRGLDKVEVRKKADEAAEKGGVVALLGDKAKKTSLYDLKRLAMARLHLRDYSNLLIDDITSGLSRDEAQGLWREVAPLLLQKASEGVSVIFSTTSREEAISIADRIVVMHAGELKQVGSAGQIYENPSNIWAAQAMDEDYHFERATLIGEKDKLYAVLGAEAPALTAQEFRVDISHLIGKIADGYEDEKVFVGWHASDFAENGERQEEVEYALLGDDGLYTHFTKSGARVKCKEKKSIVCTLPCSQKVKVFDFASENSLHTK